MTCRASRALGVGLLLPWRIAWLFVVAEALLACSTEPTIGTLVHEGPIAHPRSEPWLVARGPEGFEVRSPEAAEMDRRLPRATRDLAVAGNALWGLEELGEEPLWRCAEGCERFETPFAAREILPCGDGVVLLADQDEVIWDVSDDGPSCRSLVGEPARLVPTDGEEVALPPLADAVWLFLDGEPAAIARRRGELAISRFDASGALVGREPLGDVAGELAGAWQDPAGALLVVVADPPAIVRFGETRAEVPLPLGAVKGPWRGPRLGERAAMMPRRLLLASAVGLLTLDLRPDGSLIHNRRLAPSGLGPPLVLVEEPLLAEAFPQRPDDGDPGD
ncbi:MAG: hypothetical protein R3B72_20700 [Polyangiaceae bacterium]